jgi:hypothetical protein
MESPDSGVGGDISDRKLARVNAALLSTLSSKRLLTSSSSFATRSRRFLRWSKTTFGSAFSWSMHGDPLAKHSVHTRELAEEKMHRIFRRRPEQLEFSS